MKNNLPAFLVALLAFASGKSAYSVPFRPLPHVDADAITSHGKFEAGRSSSGTISSWSATEGFVSISLFNNSFFASGVSLNGKSSTAYRSLFDSEIMHSRSAERRRVRGPQGPRAVVRELLLLGIQRQRTSRSSLESAVSVTTDAVFAGANVMVPDHDGFGRQLHTFNTSLSRRSIRPASSIRQV